MTKYYTPEIEEFHVGFEFESNYVLFEEGSLKNGWNKVILSDRHNWFYDSYVNDAVPTEFRVKCLDREDIESLGFIVEFVPNCFKENDDLEEGFTLILNNQDTIILHFNEVLTTIGKQHCYNEHSGNWSFNHLFQGTIKNKSELKVLLKQLGV